LEKLHPYYVSFVSSFHLNRFTSGFTWKIPTLDHFIEALTHEKYNLINMGIIKGSNAHRVSMHKSSSACNPKTKKKGRGKVHVDPNNEGYSKPFDDSSGSKGRKGKKGKTKFGYCNRGYHPESTCMKKDIDQITQIFQKNNLGDHIPEASKKKPEYQSKRGNSHALISINFSHDAWILYSSASHHMETTKNVLSSIPTCTGPPILMGYDTPDEVISQGRLEIPHRSFENVLHVPKISVYLLSVYQITHSGT
jgi:hypothetical protein